MKLDNFFENVGGFINKTFLFNVGRLEVSPTYWQAATIVLLMFMLVLTFARLRHVYVGWSLKGFLPSVLFGFVLAIIFEGFLVLGGRTLFTEILGWENAPKPISTAIDIGRLKLVDVLGIQDEIVPEDVNNTSTAKSVIVNYQSLTSDEAETVKFFICEP